MEQQLQEIQKAFVALTFEESGHKYYVGTEPLDISVSGLISKHYKKFDAQGISAGFAKKHGRTQADVLAEWDATNLESRVRGNRVHLFGELYQFDRTLVPSCTQETAITKFWNDMPEHIVSVGAELRMYHFEQMFAGTADILLFDRKTQTYIIADYKTNKDLNKNFRGTKMLAPFNDLLDSPLSHYTLQLSYYQLLLEQVGIEISRRIIVWLDIDTGEYHMIDTPDITNRLKALTN